MYVKSSLAAWSRLLKVAPFGSVFTVIKDIGTTDRGTIISSCSLVRIKNFAHWQRSQNYLFQGYKLPLADMTFSRLPFRLICESPEWPWPKNATLSTVCCLCRKRLVWRNWRFTAEICQDQWWATWKLHQTIWPLFRSTFWGQWHICFTNKHSNCCENIRFRSPS